MRAIYKVFRVFTLGLFVLELAACGGKTDKKNNDLLDGQGGDAVKKAQEQKEKNNAIRRKILVEAQSVRVAEITEDVLILRSMLKLNKIRRSMIYTTSIDKALPEQLDMQDKTVDIQGSFPGYNLEIHSYKFKAGTLDVMALEYRFMKFTDRSEDSASQFVLIVLDKSLGDKAMVKSQFEFPSKSELKSWAKRTSKESVEPKCTENCL